MNQTHPDYEFELIRPQARVWPKPSPIFAEYVLIGVLFLALCNVINPPCTSLRPQGQLTACKSNLKNIATALELYAADHHGLYPDRLLALKNGVYLKRIPTCPAAVSMTYGNYHPRADRRNFRMYCQGDHHALAYKAVPGGGRNFPAYFGDKGLLEP